MKPNWSINVGNSGRAWLGQDHGTRRRLQQGKSDYTSFRDPRAAFARWDPPGYISDGGNAQRGVYI